MGFTVPVEAAASFTDQSELDTLDLLIIAAGHIGTGVKTGCAVTAQATPDDTVAVSSGTYDIAWAPLTGAGGNVNVLSGAANPDGTTSLAADADYFRYDFIVQNTSNQLGVLHGTLPTPTWPDYSVNPVFPTVVFTSHTVLGAVLIPPTSSGITGIQTSQIVTKDLTLKYPSFANITGTLTVAQGLGKSQALTGAISATNYVGATASVAPTTGTFAIGDFVVTHTGKVYICTTAGTPGTWTQVGSTVATLLGTDTFWAAKGDLAVATANDTAAVLTVGANDTMLMADSVQTTGQKWATPTQVLAALDMQRGVLAADQNFTVSNTTLQTITGMAFTIGASATEIWFVEVYLEQTAANATMDSKYGWTVPASAAMRWGAIHGAVTALPGYGTGTAPAGMLAAAGTHGAGTLIGTSGIAFAGKVYGGGTGGTVQFQGCQNTSDAGQLTILGGSFLRATKLRA